MTFNSSLVIGIGELLWDVFDDVRRPGGAPANVAFQVRQLGLRGIPFSRVGTDELGDDLVDFLSEHGLETDLIQRDGIHLTGIASVDQNRESGPQFVFRPDSAWDHLAFTDSVRGWMQSAAAVCFGTLAQRSETTRDTIYACLDATSPDCLVVYDANLRRPWYQADWIESSLARAGVLKVSDAEVEVLSDLLEIGAQDTQPFAAAMLDRYDLKLVCITRGANGCLLAARGESADVPGRPVEVVDTVGAGDAFTAALIRARLGGWPLRAAAEFANEVGALVAGRAGAMPPLQPEYQALVDRYRAELET